MGEVGSRPDGLRRATADVGEAVQLLEGEMRLDVGVGGWVALAGKLAQRGGRGGQSDKDVTDRLGPPPHSVRNRTGTR